MEYAQPKRLGLLGSIMVLVVALIAMAWLYILLIGVEPPVGGGA